MKGSSRAATPPRASLHRRLVVTTWRRRDAVDVNGHEDHGRNDDGSILENDEGDQMGRLGADDGEGDPSWQPSLNDASVLCVRARRQSRQEACGCPRRVISKCRRDTPSDVLLKTPIGAAAAQECMAQEAGAEERDRRQMFEVRSMTDQGEAEGRARYDDSGAILDMDRRGHSLIS